VFVKKKRDQEYVVPRIFVQIDNQLIENKSETKLLGLTLDNQLNWNAHVAQIQSSCNCRINLLRTLRWNNIIDANKTKNLYISMIRSKLEYGLPAWIKMKKPLRDKLQVIENDCLRAASQVTRRMHVRIEDLHKDHEIEMLDTRRKELTRKYIERKRHDPLLLDVMNRIDAENPIEGWHALMSEYCS